MSNYCKEVAEYSRKDCIDQKLYTHLEKRFLVTMMKSKLDMQTQKVNDLIIFKSIFLLMK